MDDFSHKNLFGHNVLHYAAQYNCFTTVEELLERELLTELSVPTIDSGRTPLHLAVISKSSRIVRFLIRHGVQDQIRDGNGKFAHDYANTGSIFNAYYTSRLLYNRRHNIWPTPRSREVMGSQHNQLIDWELDAEIQRIKDSRSARNRRTEEAISPIQQMNEETPSMSASTSAPDNSATEESPTVNPSSTSPIETERRGPTTRSASRNNRFH